MTKIFDQQLLFGGDYNPEQWPEESWPLDIQKLQQAHINSATINVFSWALLEPMEGKFNFSKLDKIINLLVQNNFKIVLATATAAMPAWMARKYPEVNRVDSNGVRQRHGKRHNACPNSPAFKRLASNLVKQIAQRYAKLPNISYWHVSNEYGGLCYCDNCSISFRNWLKKRYVSLTNLNIAWNSNFWGHTLNSWDDILPPMHTTDLFSNGKPVLGGAALDYQRFQSDSLLANYQMERDIIRQYDKTTEITTNLMGTQKDLDYFKWAKEMDVIAWDNYPSYDTPISFTAMQHDLMYGLKQQPFLLMEQTPNQQNWQSFNALKRPGEMRMLSFQALAHGANSIQFFQLKQSLSGAEKFHSAVIPHSDKTNGRVFNEVSQLGKDLQKIPSVLLKARKKNKVAIIFDWDSYWGLENCIGPTTKLDYVATVHSYYRALYEVGVSVDLISTEMDLMQYQLVLAPNLYVANQAFTSKINDYVKNGGHFLTTTLSGLTDDHDHIIPGGYPGAFRDVLGITFDETDALASKYTVDLLDLSQNKIGTGSVVCDLIQNITAQTLATYAGPVFYQGLPAVTKNQFGLGEAYYIGTVLNSNYLSKLLCNILKITPSETHNSSIEVTTRVASNTEFHFVINTSDKAQLFYNPWTTNKELLTQQYFSKVINLKPFEVLIF
ncbi:beta-galactosidase [Pediococcus acidilactici]|uniref:beta-galactosidase n=1 Tax=Pediococcus acidilactici TaxID=1254 RepID=UPI002AFF934C|nr:beta-galactosidase [Pediococcus acidilactici]WQS11754.1 beta-galactosidase [Pediococcus acidilactici]